MIITLVLGNSIIDRVVKYLHLFFMECSAGKTNYNYTITEKFSRAHWSKNIVDESIGHKNDVTCNVT